MNKKETKKITLYKRGGKLYYKKGGKMCLYKGGGPVRYRNGDTLPKHQIDPYTKGPIYTNNKFNTDSTMTYDRERVKSFEELMNDYHQNRVKPPVDTIKTPPVSRKIPEGWGKPPVFKPIKILPYIPERDSSERVNFPRIIGSDNDRKMVNYQVGGNLPKYQGTIKPFDQGNNSTWQYQDPDPYAYNPSASTNPNQQVRVDPLQTIEGGATPDYDAQNIKNIKGKADYNKAMGYATMAANIGSMALDKYVPKTGRDYGNSEEHRTALKDTELGEQAEIHKTVDGMIPMWGAIHQATTTGLDAIDQKDEYGRSKSKVAGAVTNFHDPSRVVNIVVDDFKKGEYSTGVLNALTAGIYGQFKMDDKVAAADANVAFRKDRESKFDGSQQGTTKSGIYAREGKEITTPRNVLNDKWNAEIENGEIVIDTTGKNIPNIRYGGTNTHASLQSPYAVKFTGDKHGQDSNKDGQEGIPIKAAEGLYVASNYLGLDGKRAKKGQKTTAQEMQPIVESLANADTNSMDAYKNNDEFITHQLKQLEEMKNDAEAAKVAEELKKLLSKKNRDMGEIAAFIQQNAQYLLDDPNAQQQNLPQMEQGNPNMQMARNGDFLRRYQDGDKIKKILYPGDAVTTDENGDYTGTKSNIKLNTIDAQNKAGFSQETGMPTDLSAKFVTAGGGNYDDVFTPKGYLTPSMKSTMVNQYGMTDDDASKVTFENLQDYTPIGQKIKDYYGILNANQTLRSADPNVRGKIGLNQYRNSGAWITDIVTKTRLNKDQFGNPTIPDEFSIKSPALQQQILRAAKSSELPTRLAWGPEMKAQYDTNVLKPARTIKTNPSTILKKHESTPRFTTRGEAFNYYKYGPGKGPNVTEFEFNGKMYNLDGGGKPGGGKPRDEKDPDFIHEGDEAHITNELMNKRRGGMTSNRHLLRKLLRKQNGGALQTYQEGKIIKAQRKAAQEANEEANEEAIQNYIRAQQNLASSGWITAKQQAENQRTRAYSAVLNQQNPNKSLGVREYLNNYQQGGSLPTYQGENTLQYLQNRANDPRRTSAERAKSRNELSLQLERKRSQIPGASDSGRSISFDASEFGGVDSTAAPKRYAPTLYTQPDGTLGTTRAVRTVAPSLKNKKILPAGYTEEQRRASGQIFEGELKNVPSTEDYFAPKRKPLQQGGPIPGQEQEQPNESNEHLQQLIGEQMQQDPNANMQPGMEEQMAAEQQMAGQEGEMNAQQGMVPPVLANIDPQLQQVFMQLPPEVQEQILSLPPEQIEIALMNVMEQMMGGQGGEQQMAEQQMAAQQQMAAEQSQVPPGVMEQLG